MHSSQYSLVMKKSHVTKLQESNLEIKAKTAESLMFILATILIYTAGGYILGIFNLMLSRA